MNKIVTLSSLSAAVVAAEKAHKNAISKGFHSTLSAKTRRNYQKQVPKLQASMIDARKAKIDFINAQRSRRGLGPISLQ